MSCAGEHPIGSCRAKWNSKPSQSFPTGYTGDLGQRWQASTDRKGDQAVIHELRGRESNRKLSSEVEQQAITILSDRVYRGFGPTLASEYLHKLHRITVSKETRRRWMAKAGLWRVGHVRVVEVHLWRPRRSRCGELVQWDTSTHDWLEGRGEEIYLISMIDDATSRLFARFVRHDTSEENMRLLWAYLEQFGRPPAFYTDKAGMFL